MTPFASVALFGLLAVLQFAGWLCTGLDLRSCSEEVWMPTRTRILPYMAMAVQFFIQFDLVRRVQKPGYKWHQTTTKSSYFDCMIADLNILDRNLTNIIQFVNIDHLRPVLMEQGTILPEEHDRLVQQSASFADSFSRKKISIEELVGMLRHKGCRGIRGFIQALDKTGNECMGHDSIVNILKQDSGYDCVMNSSEDR